MINERERNLTFLVTFLMFSGGDNVDFDQSFFNVLGDLTLDFISTMILTLIFYYLITKPLYKWLVKNSK